MNPQPLLDKPRVIVRSRGATCDREINRATEHSNWQKVYAGDEVKRVKANMTPGRWWTGGQSWGDLRLYKLAALPNAATVCRFIATPLDGVGMDDNATITRVI